MSILAEGLVIDGRFRIAALLGSGGMGVVYKAEQIGLSRTVALKLLRREAVSEEAYQARFKREAEILSQLKHRNITLFFGYGVANMGSYSAEYLAMEFIDGGQTLASMLEAEKQLTVADALRITRDIAAGLASAHAQGILHRDIKPANIFITRVSDEQIAKLGDFGLAKLVGIDRTSQKLTAEGFAVGTPAYMSPEVSMGLKSTAQSDIYGLGCVLYECLFGMPPFRNDLHNLDKLQLPPQTIRFAAGATSKQNLPEPVRTILEKSLAYKPEERFESADQLLVALQECSSNYQSANWRLNRENGIVPIVPSRKTKWLPAAGLTILCLCSLILLTLAALCIAPQPGRRNFFVNHRGSIADEGDQAIVERALVHARLSASTTSERERYVRIALNHSKNTAIDPLERFQLLDLALDVYGSDRKQDKLAWRIEALKLGIETRQPHDKIWELRTRLAQERIDTKSYDSAQKLVDANLAEMPLYPESVDPQLLLDCLTRKLRILFNTNRYQDGQDLVDSYLKTDRLPHDLKSDLATAGALYAADGPPNTTMSRERAQQMLKRFEQATAEYRLMQADRHGLVDTDRWRMPILSYGLLGAAYKAMVGQHLAVERRLWQLTSEFPLRKQPHDGWERDVLADIALTDENAQYYLSATNASLLCADQKRDAATEAMIRALDALSTKSPSSHQRLQELVNAVDKIWIDDAKHGRNDLAIKLLLKAINVCHETESRNFGSSESEMRYRANLGTELEKMGKLAESRTVFDDAIKDSEPKDPSKSDYMAMRGVHFCIMRAKMLAIYPHDRSQAIALGKHILKLSECERDQGNPIIQNVRKQISQEIAVAKID